MEKLPALTSRTKILIMQWFQMLRPGEVCTMEQIYDYTKRHGCNTSLKTIKNNLAWMKKEGYIDYHEKRMIEKTK